MKLVYHIPKFVIGIVVLFALFSFVEKDISASELIKKMNQFYFNKAISLTYEVSYDMKDGQKISEDKASIKMQNSKYLQEDNSQLIFSDGSYIILVDKQEKSMTVREISEKSNKNKNSFLDFGKIVDSTFTEDQTSIKEIGSNYILSIEGVDLTTILTLSKSNYSLVNFQYIFKNDKYYSSLNVKYSNINLSNKFSSSFFDVKKFIKKKKKKYIGVGKYKGYNVN